ncbi:hypothetical protein P3S68_007853 [Capsicum galapagoense]
MLPGGSIAKEVEPIKGRSKPERASVFAKFVAQTAALHLNKKSASSVEAEIIGGSILRSHAQPKQEASTASSKSYTFKKGLAQAGSVAIETKQRWTPISGESCFAKCSLNEWDSSINR